MTEATRRDRDLRARRRSAIITEAVRIFGPTDGWDAATLTAIDAIAGIADLRALHAIGFVFANVVARD